jgi:hypothetical protein
LIHWILAGLFLPAMLVVIAQVKEYRSQTTIYAVRLPSGPLFIGEDPKHPKLTRLRKQERIDRVVAGAATDLEQLLRLAQWTSRQFPATTPFPNYPPWDAGEILQRIRQKQTGGFCAQYAFVFGQLAQSLGYNVRYLGILNTASQQGHALLEVFVPSTGRWIVFEPQFGRYYIDKEGKALGALDLHYYAVGEKKGRVDEFPQRRPMDPAWLALFQHFKYMLRNNFLSVPVYYTEQARAGGWEMSFEPYQIRWLDRHTRRVKEVFPSLTSSRPEDFEFSMDLRAAAKSYSCRTAGDFAKFAQEAVPGNLYRLRLPAPLLTQIIESVLIQNPHFKPLR